MSRLFICSSPPERMRPPVRIIISEFSTLKVILSTVSYLSLPDLGFNILQYHFVIVLSIHDYPLPIINHTPPINLYPVSTRDTKLRTFLSFSISLINLTLPETVIFSPAEKFCSRSFRLANFTEVFSSTRSRGLEKSDTSISMTSIRNTINSRPMSFLTWITSDELHRLLLNSKREFDPSSLLLEPLKL